MDSISSGRQLNLKIDKLEETYINIQLRVTCIQSVSLFHISLLAYLFAVTSMI